MLPSNKWSHKGGKKLEHRLLNYSLFGGCWRILPFIVWRQNAVKRISFGSLRALLTAACPTESVEKGWIIDDSFVKTADLLLVQRSGKYWFYLFYFLTGSVQCLLKKPQDRTVCVRNEEMVSIFVSAWLIRQDAVGRTRCEALSSIQTLFCTYTLLTVCE